MKVIISPNSGSFSLKRELLEELFERFPDLFQDAFPVEELRLPGQTDEEVREWHDSAVLQGDSLYFLKDRNPELRTLPYLVELLEEKGSDALTGRYCSSLKLVEFPDNGEWYLYTHDDGTEAIHERHRVWR